MRFKELTQEQIEYLKSFDGEPREVAYYAFNEKYGTKVALSTIKSWLVKLGVKATGNGRFDGTQTPWAKGLTKEQFWARFSKEGKAIMLNAPLKANRTAKVGDVHIKDGVPYVVTSLDYNKYYDERREPLRRVVWKKHYGEIPDHYMIIHLNGNRLDCRIENLAMIPKRYRPTVLRHMKTENAELTKGVIKYCELVDAIKEAKEEM